MKGQGGDRGLKSGLRGGGPSFGKGGGAGPKATHGGPAGKGSDRGLKSGLRGK